MEQDIKNALAEMVRLDQEVRNRNDATEEEINETDRRNTNRLKEIIGKHGWIAVSKFGKQPSNHAWILVQHADLDPDFQEYCLGLMNSAADGEVPKRNIAYLTDRLMVQKTGTQKFGTQFIDMGEYTVLRPVENMEKLNELRAEADLEPIDEYLNIHAEATGVPAYKTLDDAKGIV